MIPKMPAKLAINKLTHRNIRPYGIIIDARRIAKRRRNAFGIILKERSKGWRIGYLVVRERIIERLESHPDSFETFEPVVGRTIIAFAPNKRPDKVKVFRLDRPVIIKKGVWHEVAAISGHAEIKIFENIEVKVKYHFLKKAIKA